MPTHAHGRDTAGVTVALDLQLRRLLWRCRRGMKELDVLLGRFVRATSLDGRERQLLEGLLEMPDPLLAAYFLWGEAPEDPELAALVDRIRTYVA
jgi:antitoxin CptB